MEKREDRRILRTKGMILDALLDLMIEKGYDAITIQEIIDRANVGRSTFYAHFQDKEQLLAASVGQLRQFLRHQVLQQKEASGATQEGTAALVRTEGQQKTGAKAMLEEQKVPRAQAETGTQTGAQALPGTRAQAEARTKAQNESQAGAPTGMLARAGTQAMSETQAVTVTADRAAFRWEYSLPLFQHIQSHKRVYRSTVGGSNPSAAVMQHMHAMIAELFEDQIGRMPHKPEHIPGEVLVAFTVGTFLTLVAWWMDQPKPCSAEEVDRMFHRLTLAGLSPKSLF